MSEFEELHEQIARLETWNAKKQLQLNEVAERLSAAVGPEYWGVHLLDAVENELKKLRDENGKLWERVAQLEVVATWAVNMDHRSASHCAHLEHLAKGIIK